MLIHRVAAKAIARTRLEVPSAIGGSERVVIVNGSAEALELVETVLDSGHYNIVFVESSAHAYSQIKRVQPNLVILCMGVVDNEALQVLSMLKLDAETRNIPVMTWTTDRQRAQEADDGPEASDQQIFPFKPAPSMN